MLLAQEKAVRVLLLSLMQQLNLPEKPSTKQLEAAATAATTLRKRIGQEKDRVQHRIARMEAALAGTAARQLRDPNNLVGEDEDNGDGDDAALQAERRQQYSIESALKEDKSRELTRHEFLFISEMQATKGGRSVLADMLCLHGMRHAAVLLAPLLKLLAAMTAPPERLCADRHRVIDAVEHLRTACATDDFFTLLVQCVAPIAGKRRDGPLARQDIAMLELALHVFNNLLTGPVASVVPVVGAMCRSHGVELLLVVLHQNYSSFLAIQQQQQAEAEAEERGALPTETSEEEESDEEATIIGVGNAPVTAEGTSHRDAHVASLAAANGAAPPQAEEITRGDSPLPPAETEGEAVLLPDSQQIAEPPHTCHDDVSIFEVQQATVLEIVDEDGFELMDPFAAATDLELFEGGPHPDAAAVATSDTSSDDAGDDAAAAAAGKAVAVNTADESEEESEEEAAADDDDEEEDEEDDDIEILDEAFKHDAELAELLRDEETRGETSEHVLSWNLLILNAMSLILRCGVPAIDLASWSPDSDTANVFALVEQSAARIRLRQSEDVTWRHFAKHRNGSTTSTGLLVRKRGDEAPPQVVLGSVTQLLAGNRRTPLERLMEADKKKRGKFNRKQLTAAGMTDTLPVPTLLHLTKQIATFLSSGFEALSQMVWSHVKQQLVRLDETVQELRETQARPAFIDEGPMLSDLNGLSTHDALRYCGTVAAMLRLTRESLRQHRDMASHGLELSPSAQKLLEEHWRAASHVMTLEHAQRGFDLLGAFAASKELFLVEDVCVVMDYVSEMLLVLVALMAGEIVDDPAVTMPAHALGSSLLFNEANTKAVWVWVGHPRIGTHRQLQSATLLLHSLFALMEQSSFNGAFAVPKRKATNGGRGKHAAAHDTAGDGKGVADEAVDEDGDSDSDADGAADSAARDDAKFIDDAEDDPDKRRARRAQRRAARKQQQQLEALQQQQAAAAQRRAKAVVDIDDGDDGGPVFPDEVEETAYDALRQQQEKAKEDGEGEGVVVIADDDDEPNPTGAFTLLSGEGRLPLSLSRRSGSRETAGHRSLASSGHISLTSEREAHVDEFYLRLSSQRNAQMLLRTFQMWRLNDWEPNHAVEQLLDRLQRHPRARCVLFTAHFLAVVNDVLQHGQETHPSLFQVCDLIAFDFFNPAKVEGPHSDGMHRLDVALRCTRSLFFLQPSAYTGLDDYFRPLYVEQVDMEPIVGEDGYVLGMRPVKAGDTVDEADGTAAAPPKPAKQQRRRKGQQPAEPAAAADSSDRLMDGLDDLPPADAPQPKRSKPFKQPKESKRRAKMKQARDSTGEEEEQEEQEAQAAERSDDDSARQEKKRRRKERKEQRRHRRDGADTTRDEEKPAASATFTDDEGNVCVVGDDGVVYQVQGTTDTGLYYIYRPGVKPPQAMAAGAGGGGSPNAADECAAAGEDEDGGAANYRAAEDDLIRKLQDQRTIAAPHSVEPPLTHEFLQEQAEAAE